MKTFKTQIVTLLFAGCLAATGLVETATADVQTYNETLRSTTWVLAKTSEGTSSGTGVLIDAEKKIVVTNAHVVGDSRGCVLFFPELKDGKPIVTRSHYLTNVRRLGIRGRVIAVDRKRDLALVQLDKLPENAKAIELATESAGPGQAVQSVGNAGSTEALWVYNSGTVRAIYRKQFRTGAGEHDFTVVETQNPINSGDSGGPVVNAEGKLIAISQAIAPKARLVSYCVDISEVRALLASPWKLAPLPVTDLLDKAELKYTKHESGHYTTELEDSDKKKQTVFITKDVEYYERADVRKVWALAKISNEAPSLDTTMLLLEQSARTKLGSWTIEKTREGQYLIIYVVKMDATATPDAMKSTMQYVAKLTGVMQKQLAPKAKEVTTENANDTLNEWLSK